MKVTHLFQMSLEEAGSFFQDIIYKSVEQVLQQGAGLALLKQDTSTPEELINTEDVCKLLGITRVTCDNWRKTEKLPYKRIGARILFDKQEVLAALQNFKRRAR